MGLAAMWMMVACLMIIAWSGNLEKKGEIPSEHFLWSHYWKMDYVLKCCKKTSKQGSFG